MTYTQALALATRHVKEGRERVAILTADIAKAKAASRSAFQAEAGLVTMLTTPNLMIDHQKAIRASLAQVKPARPPA